MPSIKDPYLWLEEVDGKEPLEWVEQRNLKTKEWYCTGASFDALCAKIRDALDSDDRIPAFVAYGSQLYNFWQDKDHPRGIWRRTTLDEYKKKEPTWETLLDLDALAEEEGENWVWAGHSMFRPDIDRALIHLSRGGGDAAVVREFDVDRLCFLANGFSVPEAKTRVSWAGRDKLLIGTDFGPGSMTDSGYPMTIRVWERGTDLDSAQEIFRGEASDVSVGASADPSNGYSEYYITRATDFYNTELSVMRGDRLVRIDKPASANANIHRGRLFVRLKSEWKTESADYSAGSLLTCDLDSYINEQCGWNVLFVPSENTTLEGWGTTRDDVVLSVSENVRTKAYLASETSNGWTTRSVSETTDILNESIQSLDPYDSNDYLLNAESFLVPSTLSIGSESAATEVLKQAPSFFDGSQFEASQHWANSKDGTKIPYYQIRRNDVTDPAPTLLYGYGGFEISLLPQYSATIGIGWLERGGNYVVANIRGGGEFGPSWHHSALKEHRHRAYDDFIAVGEDLVSRGIVEPNQLGIQGGSNGGLLMGNMYTRRPDLFGAVACQVPLLDMSRYHLLLAGASWMAEYGDPDNPEDWEFLKGYSPYHNVDSEGEYPPILITTSTRDDRVHPGHARKMTARLEEFGHPIHYYENTAGGHAGAADNSQRAFMLALVYEFLWNTLTNA